MESKEEENYIKLQEVITMRQYRLQMCQDWLVHEDGAFAYREQNQEFDRHYGLNRYNRRTVREDIPVAKVVQSQEERRQQQERYQELQALRAQAEEDEEIAKRVADEMKGEDLAQQRQRELEDEEIARKTQEKENEKYEKYLEKKRVKELKKEREILEKKLQHNSEQAGLAARSQDVSATSDHLRDTHLNNSTVAAVQRGAHNSRVMPTGRIEDDGDFTDFYPNLPEHVDPQQRRFIQETADEELARLLQEQEHKRTKAEVDKNKLKEIEEQDARLAKIIHEQEKIKLKKAKQKKKSHQEESQRPQTTTNPATRPLPDLPGHRPSDLPQQRSKDHRHLRRDSFLQSLNNGPQDPNTTSPESEISAHTNSRVSHGSHSSNRSSANDRHRNQQRNIQPPESLPSSSVRSIERWLEDSVNEPQSLRPVPPPTENGRQRGRLRSDENIPSPSPPGSYHSDEEIPYRPQLPQRGRNSNNYPPEENHYAVSNPISFNIAAAIDPTYKRRQHEFENPEETDAKIPASLSSSVPLQAESELEWDPSLRGSLRRTRGTWNQLLGTNAYRRETLGSMDENFPDDGPVMNPWQPVQGQRRSASEKNRRVPRPPPTSSNTKQKGSCKQQ
ncbi:hypothetical protein FSP39_010041 [Pinctada imbricata]|uniref:Coiled-coil domain-containing protein n=1 Tax=Pinctada imbricata TaxID=66713 RepID=A0AA89CC12_PINIB|nr:hypothetical protein FSP39_010041 [Pinctada imbricata]